ncbi:metal-dependent hydrolase [Clostridium saccharoperbutylacetonicum]|uniref:metal-dependent hydrolase n=1 Tax=Clostridium saccharoperbutylacetonicum TaxID=36745 RepID=UPI0039ECD1B1
MPGKTHAAIGVMLTTMILLPTNDIKYTLANTALAVVGAFTVDIDTAKSQGATFLKKIFGTIVAVIILGAILKIEYNINIFNYILENRAIHQLIPGLSILVGALIMGVITPHRSFTHSMVGVIAFTIPIYMLAGPLYKGFLIGYIAHILADMLNEKEVKILWPMKKGICLNLCSADGIVAKILFVVSIGVTVLQYKNYFNI